MIILPFESFLRDVIIMVIVRVAAEYNPGSVDVNISIQIHLILEFIHVDSMHSDDIADSEDAWELFDVFGEELKTDVGH